MLDKTCWNWEQKEWPEFHFNSVKLISLEAEFLHRSGIFSGAAMHVGSEDRQQLIIEIMTDEAFETSEIEGEFLSRENLQSSLRKQFGLTTDQRKIPPAEAGIAQMMMQIYQHFDATLTHDLLFDWHRMLMNGRQDLADIGCYRVGELPMQIVSGSLDNLRVHFEAPPATRLQEEITVFLHWFAETGVGAVKQLPILTRAGIAHLYFESIHPFEDGNGRIGRAIAEKVLSEGLSRATLIALSHAINAKRSTYYKMLEQTNRTLEITDWLIYFAETILEAQSYSQRLLEFIIAKKVFYDRLQNSMNKRQARAIARMFREGLNGFKGGLSAKNYITITGASQATATRDLNDLVTNHALTKSGSLKSTRYQLNLPTIWLRQGC